MKWIKSRWIGFEEEGTVHDGNFFICWSHERRYSMTLITDIAAMENLLC